MKIDIARRDHSAPTGIFSSKRVAIYDADVVIAADEHEVARLDSWARQVGMMDEILFSEPIEDLGAERDYKIKEVLKGLRKTGCFKFEISVSRPGLRDELVETLTEALKAWKGRAILGPTDDTGTIEI